MDLVLVAQYRADRDRIMARDAAMAGGHSDSLDDAGAAVMWARMQSEAMEIADIAADTEGTAS